MFKNIRKAVGGGNKNNASNSVDAPQEAPVAPETHPERSGASEPNTKRVLPARAFYQKDLGVIEVIEYIDDSDYDGADDCDFEEEVVEIVEEVVPRKNFSAVPAYEVGIGAAPPPFLTPKEKAIYVFNYSNDQVSSENSKNINNNNGSAAAQQQQPRRASAQKKPGVSQRRKTEIVNQALVDTGNVVVVDGEYEEYEEYEEEIYDEEEIIEEEYYDEEEIIEEEYYDEEIIEEVIAEHETEEEAKHRKELEAEIAEIERRIEEAKRAKEKRISDEGGGETSKEKAERMANASRLEEAQKRKKENDFKWKAAARAKVMAEREANWGKKGKKKEKTLSDIIAAKAKKQHKLLTRQKSRDPPPPPRKTKPVEEKPKADEEEQPKEEKKELSLMEMLALKQSRGASDMTHMKTKKAPVENERAQDDYGEDGYDLRAEDFLPSDDEEEEEEEEEVLSPEEEKARRLEWQKPTWTNAVLKTTVKGTQVKKGKNLAGEITNVKKNINEGLDEDDEEKASAGALMEGAKKMVMLPKVKKHHANLKFTVNGARIRDGRYVEAPINSKTKKSEEVKIWGADPDELRMTPRGLTARKGKILEEGGITQATQKKKYQFEKPEWAQSRRVRQTDAGQALKEGQDLVEGATMATQTKKYEFEKPEWLKPKLKHTDTGEKLKEGANLAKPIVVLDRKAMNVNLEANPAFLKMTDKGERLMEDGNLAAPITQLPDMMKQKGQGRYNDT